MTSLKKIFPLLSILLGILILRLPSFFEPHWYGDEEIYLVLGQMMRRGAILYRDIWDNKTPLLYFIYSISPTLFWAKLTATLFVLGTTLGIYKLSQKIFYDRPTVYSLVPTALVGVLLSLPLLEGNIANAELYFTLPIILGTILIYRSLTSGYKLQIPIWIGLLTSVAFLLKVPAVFDFLGLFLAYFSIKLVDESFSPTRNFKNFLVTQVKFHLLILISFIVPIVLILLYFLFHHALADFLTAAFSQNASYVAIDSGPFSKLSNPIFVKGIILLIGIIAVTIAYFKRYVSRELVLLLVWFGFSLYGALLSNRPYMHYLLQIVPPLVLLGIYLVAHTQRYFFFNVGYVLLIFTIARMFTGAFTLNPVTYYQNFLDWAAEKKEWHDYINYFDGRTTNYYEVANLISQNTKSNDPIFVWGDVAAIYTISDRPAATKFIQAHHLTTVDPKNYDLIIARLEKFQPKYIFIARPVQFGFPKLEIFVKKNYREVQIFGNFHVYQNISPVTPQPWKL